MAPKSPLFCPRCSQRHWGAVTRRKRGVKGSDRRDGESSRFPIEEQAGGDQDWSAMGHEAIIQSLTHTESQWGILVPVASPLYYK